MPTTLTVAQTAVAQQIIQYGQQNGFTSAQQQTAVKAAFIESSLGVGMQNPGSTAQGLFGYTVGQWAVSGNGGSIGSNSDQIAAFYGDITKYTARFNALPSSTTDGITVDEYIYVKHHDGTNATDFSDSAPGISIWNGTSFTAPVNLFTQQHGDISDPSSIGNLAQLLEPQLASNGGSLPTYDPTAVSDSLTAALAADGGQLSGTPSLTSSSKLSFTSTSGDQYLASRDGTVTRLTSDASGNLVALNFSGGTLVGNVTFTGTNGHATLNGDGTISATTPQGSFSYDLADRTVVDPNAVTTTINTSIGGNTVSILQPPEGSSNQPFAVIVPTTDASASSSIKVLNILDQLTKSDGNHDLVQAIISNRELAFGIAGLMRQHGKLAESAAVCELILRESPADTECLLLLVRNLSDQGQIEQALRRLREGRDSGLQEDAILGEIKRQMLVAVGSYEKCLAAGDPAGAEKICDSLVALCPGQSMFLNAQWELRQLLANSYREKCYTSLRDLAIAYSNEGNLEAELKCRLALFKDPLHARQNSADQLDTIFHAVSRLIGADQDIFESDRIAQIRELLSAIKTIPPSPAGPDASESDLYRSRFDLWYRLLLGSIDLDVIFGPPVGPQPKLPTSFAAADGSPLTIDEVARRGRQTNAELAFFAATSPEYFVRFAETYIASILANCDCRAMIFVLLSCPEARMQSVIAGFPIQDPRLIFCCDNFDAQARPYLMALATETELSTVPIYYAYAALLRCDYILDHLAIPVIVTGIDTVLQRGITDLLGRFAHADVVLNKIGSHFGLGGQIVNNLSLTFPTPKGDLFIQFLKKYSCDHLEQPIQASFQDQLDIHMAKHHLLANGEVSKIGYFDEYDINNIMFDKGNYEGFREMLQRYRFVNIFANGCEANPLSPGDLAG